MSRKINIIVLLALSATLSAQIVVKEQGYVPFADAPIHYRSENLHDPIAKLQERLDSGATALHFEPGHGYLTSVLQALQVPVESQTLVFSKTSFQFPKISPDHPRALYYNDDVYVGQVHGAQSLEFVSFDPMQGAIFYVLDEHRVEHPRFERAMLDCVQCHVAQNTARGVPGVLVRSVFTGPTGTQTGGTKAFVTGQESPLKDRWGGWYVTGTEGSEGHMGNALLPSGAAADQLDRLSGVNLRDLTLRVNTAEYLTPYSDIVAQLVLAHQTQMHNLITLTNYQTRLGKPFEKPAEQLIRYLLFTNEVRLEEPVRGTSGFAEEFAARGPRDAQGRSLRDFDLNARIFRYPCSYLIYSEAFDTIPEPAKSYIYRRLLEVLSGRDRSPDFVILSDADRQAILEILVATKPGLPEEWKLSAKEAAKPTDGLANRQH